MDTNTTNARKIKTYMSMPRGFANDYDIIVSDDTPASRKLFAYRWLRTSSFEEPNGNVVRRVSKRKYAPYADYMIVNGKLYVWDFDEWLRPWDVAEGYELEAAKLYDEEVAYYYRYLTFR